MELEQLEIENRSKSQQNERKHSNLRCIHFEMMRSVRERFKGLKDWKLGWENGVVRLQSWNGLRRNHDGFVSSAFVVTPKTVPDFLAWQFCKNSKEFTAVREFTVRNQVRLIRWKLLIRNQLWTILNPFIKFWSLRLSFIVESNVYGFLACWPMRKSNVSFVWSALPLNICFHDRYVVFCANHRGSEFWKQASRLNFAPNPFLDEVYWQLVSQM